MLQWLTDGEPTVAVLEFVTVGTDHTAFLSGSVKGGGRLEGTFGKPTTHYKLRITGSLEPHYESNRNIQAPYVRCVEAVDELNLKIADKMDKLFTLRCEISDAIDSVSSIDSREVLACRYLCCMTWEDICSELKISEKTARRRHNKGIETIRID